MKDRIYILDIRKPFCEEACKEAFPERYKKAQRFLREEDRRRSIGAGVLLNRVLGLREEDITAGEHGKPYAAGISEAFNISHSGSYCVLAVSQEEIGVDIEYPEKKHLPAAKSVMTEEELSYIREDAVSRFFTLWTLKEAFSKAVGGGLTVGFRNVDALILLRGEGLKREKTVYYAETAYYQGYALSVCTGNRRPKPEIISRIEGITE